jgi:hypothetical protein
MNHCTEQSRHPSHYVILRAQGESDLIDEPDQQDYGGKGEFHEDSPHEVVNFSGSYLPAFVCVSN